MQLKMVENNVIYEDICLKQEGSLKTLQELTNTGSKLDNYLLKNNHSSSDNESVIYVDMNENVCVDIGDENVDLIQFEDKTISIFPSSNNDERETSFSIKISSTPPKEPPENKLTRTIVSNIQASHKRKPSSSSNGSIPSTTETREHYRKTHSFSSVSEKEKPDLKEDNTNTEETIYAEIASGTSTSDITSSRTTRESDNPILRQSITNIKINPMKRVSSLTSVQQRSKRLNTNLIHHTYSPNNQEYAIVNKHKYDLRSKSIERNYRKENFEKENNFNNLDLVSEIYQNSTKKQCSNLEGYSLYCYPEDALPNIESLLLYGNSIPPVSLRNHLSNQTISSDIYENAIENKLDNSRDRSCSRPISISQVNDSKEQELIYTDVKFNEKFSTRRFDSCSSLPSSSRGSSCGSASSEFSSNPSHLIGPSTVASFRQNAQWCSGWNIGELGMNYHCANYLGYNIIHLVTYDVIDNAVSQVAQRTNVLEMKPVHVEISNEFIRFGTSASPWELLASFPIEEIISYEVILKNAFFLGIVAGKPSEDPYCYVLQSDRSNEIADTIRLTLKSDRARKSPLSSFSKSENKKKRSIIGIFKETVKNINYNSANQYQIHSSENYTKSSTFLEPELYHFNVSYICSTIISNPLKPKHIKDCYKQYMKKVHKDVKDSLNRSPKNNICGVVSLQIITNEGISMLDPNQSDFVIRSFEIETVCSFLQHPEDENHFAFSTIITDSSKIKCHLFTCINGDVAEVCRAFECLLSIKKQTQTFRP